VIAYLGSAVGDPHFTTFSGQRFDMQDVGDFVLTRSKLADQPFEIQIRTDVWSEDPKASIIAEAATRLGGHNVNFSMERAREGGSLVWVDGRPAPLGTGNPVFAVDGGRIVKFSPQRYGVFWDSGEVFNVTDNGTYLDVATALGPHTLPDSMEGLLGGGGWSGDIPLDNGKLYEQFVDAVRVTAADSLFDVVPEPPSAALFGLGLAGLAVARRPSRRKPRPAQAMAA